MRLVVFLAATALAAACTSPAENPALAQKAASPEKPGAAAPGQTAAVTPESVRVPVDNRVSQISGLVTKREMGILMLDSGGPMPIPLRVDTATEVTIDGQPATGMELREGTLVRASYRMNSAGMPMALQVVANTRPPR
jgi:hypothetical protein